LKQAPGALHPGDEEQLFHAWLSFLRQLLPALNAHPLDVPADIPDAVLARSGYIDHFPHQIVSIGSAGTGPGHSLTPAACLHVYPLWQGAHIDHVSHCIEAPCTRFEGGRWAPPYRLYRFHMLEFVVLGGEMAVQAARVRVRSLLEDAFNELGLAGAMQRATDAFFMGAGAGASRIQALKDLKQEYRVHDGAEAVALASFNYHEDYFGRCFDIHADGRAAHSFCAALGLERLAAYSFKAWGAAKAHWPAEFRRHVQVP
jgi:hypothetical protein